MLKKIILGVIFFGMISFCFWVCPVSADGKGGGMQKIDPPDPRIEEVRTLTQEKSNLELNIKDLESGLNSEAAKNNEFIRDTINGNLANARNRLSEVNGKITDLNNQIRDSLPQPSPSQPQQTAQIQSPAGNVLGDLSAIKKGGLVLSPFGDLSREGCGRDEYGYYDQFGYFDQHGYYDEDGYYWFDEDGETYDEDGYFDDEGYYAPPPWSRFRFRLKDSVNWANFTLQGTQNAGSPYVNDRWQLNDKWSFNIGVRYDEQESGKLQPQTSSGSANTLPTYAPDTLASGSLTGDIGQRFDRQSGANTGGENTAGSGSSVFPEQRWNNDSVPEWNTITPRLGLTYQIGDKTLIKSNYAMYADQLGAGTTRLNPLTSSYTYSYFSGGLEGNNAGTSTFNGFSYASDFSDQADSDLSSPKTHEAILGTTHQLGRDTAIGANFTYRPRFGGLQSGDDTAVRQYDAVEETLNKNFADNWGLVTSYRWSKQRQDFDDYSSTALIFNKRLANRWMLRGNITYADWEWDQEGVGEQSGLGGPIIANGLFGKEPGVMVYDNFGAPVGGVTRQLAQQYPSLAGDLIAQADGQSTQNFKQEFLGGIEFEVARSVSLGVRYVHRSIPQVLEDFSSAIPDYNNFTPQAVAVPRLGLMPGDAQTFGGYINNRLARGPNNKPFEFWAALHCCAVLFFDEPIIHRGVAEEAAVVPNDPLFYKPSKGPAKPEKKKSSSAMTFLGSAVKMGGVTLGAGEGSEKDKGPVIKDQWGIQKVGFLPKTDPDSAWNVIDGRDKNVVVAIIDSGIDLTHPDGPQYIWTNPGEVVDNGKDDDNNGYADDVHGWNFLDNHNDLTDYKGHGTFVAGIIAAKADNGIGIAGINPGAQIMMLKVADKFGGTNNLDIARAIYYAANQGAKIINISIAGKGKSRLEQLAINYAFKKGALVVIAGGNDGDYADNDGPGFSKRSLTVGSVDFEGPVSPITNWGPNLAVLAPGDQIYSLYSKDSEWIGSPADKERLYYKASGTSFAAPMVAATASLMLAKKPELTHRKVMDILLATASDMEEDGWDARSGAGLLNASKALREVSEGVLAVQISDVAVQRENNKVQSVDIFGIIRGNVGSYTVELGKGKKPKEWEAVAGPFKRRAEYTWLCRIDEKAFKGSRDWSVRINAIGKDGTVKTAQSVIPLHVSK